jgi:hypothetical protein
MVNKWSGRLTRTTATIIRFNPVLNTMNTVDHSCLPIVRSVKCIPVPKLKTKKRITHNRLRFFDRRMIARPHFDVAANTDRYRTV